MALTSPLKHIKSTYICRTILTENQLEIVGRSLIQPKLQKRCQMGPKKKASEWDQRPKRDL